MSNETMTDARALDFIRVYLAPYSAHGEKDQVVEHIASRLRGEAAPEGNAVLRDYAEGRIHHLNRGSCPDPIEGHNSRDHQCEVCAALSSTAAPAPVAGDADLRAALDDIGGLCRALRQGGPAPEDLQELSDALQEAVDIAHAALAQDLANNKGS